MYGCVRGAGRPHPAARGGTAGRAAPPGGRAGVGRGHVLPGHVAPPSHPAGSRGRSRRARPRGRPGAGLPAAARVAGRSAGLAGSGPGPVERAAGRVQAARGAGEDTMTAPRSMTAQVEVAVDPATAFVAFTDEMDLWWLRTPITYYDSARAIGRRCEHGVGGRLLEIYDDATGDVLELGRITA